VRIDTSTSVAPQTSASVVTCVMESCGVEPENVTEPAIRPNAGKGTILYVVANGVITGSSPR
jgi:hypothetical protein